MPNRRLPHRPAPTQFGAHSYHVSPQRFTLGRQAHVLHRCNARAQTCQRRIGSTHSNWGCNYRGLWLAQSTATDTRPRLLCRDVGRVRQVHHCFEYWIFRTRLVCRYRFSKLASEPVTLEEAVKRRTINAGEAGRA